MKKKDFFRTILLLAFFTLISFIFPFFSALIYLIWPLPLIMYIVKYGTGEAVPLVALAAIANGLLIGAIYNISSGIVMGVYSILGFGLIGFFLGSGLKEKFSPLKTLLLTILAVIISNLAIALSLPYILGFNYQDIMVEMKALMENSQFIPQYGLLLEQLLYLVKTLIPSLLLVTSAIHGILIYYITIWYVRKKGFDFHQYKPFRTWHFSRWWVSLSLISLIIVRTYLQYSYPGGLPEYLRITFANLMILLFFLIFLQGFAVMINWLGRRNSNFLLMAFIFALFFFNVFVIYLLLLLGFYLLLLLGFIDMWFNLRKDQRA